MEGFMASLLLSGTAQHTKTYTPLMQNEPGLFEFEDGAVCLLQTELDQMFYMRWFMLRIKSLSYHYF